MALCPGPVRTEFQNVANNERMRFPSFMWTEVDSVVNEAIAAAASGRALCVAGAINNAMVIASKFTPRSLSTLISGALMRPVVSAINIRKHRREPPRCANIARVLLFEQAPRDHHPLDLRSALVDLQQLGVAHQLLTGYSFI